MGLARNLELEKFLVLLRVFCYTNRSVLCPVVIREASPDSRWEWVQRSGNKHEQRTSKAEVFIASIPSEILKEIPRNAQD